MTLYEPGSTFKIITMAQDSPRSGAHGGWFSCPGFKIVEDRRIHRHKRTDMERRAL